MEKYQLSATIALTSSQPFQILYYFQKEPSKVRWFSYFEFCERQNCDLKNHESLGCVSYVENCCENQAFPFCYRAVRMAQLDYLH